MPKDKELTRLIPRIYKWNYENLALFIWVKAQMSLIRTITLDQAIQGYMKFTGITFEDWDLDSMKSTYTRLQNEFYDCMKNESAKENK